MKTKSMFILGFLLIALLISCSGCQSKPIDENVIGNWQQHSCSSTVFNNYSKANIEFTSLCSASALFSPAKTVELYPFRGTLTQEGSQTLLDISGVSYIVYINSDENYEYLNIELDGKIASIYKKEVVHEEK